MPVLGRSRPPAAYLLVQRPLALLTPPPAPPVPQQGSWWGLVSVLRHNRQEFDWYVSTPPMACPNCGEPLTNSPSTDAGSGKQLFCKFDGWAYPRDWQPPVRPDPQGVRSW